MSRSGISVEIKNTRILKYTYGVTDLQAEALGDYFTSGSYKTGDIPTVMEGARPSPDFIGPMPPEYYGRTPVGVEGVRPSPDFSNFPVRPGPDRSNFPVSKPGPDCSNFPVRPVASQGHGHVAA